MPNQRLPSDERLKDEHLLGLALQPVDTSRWHEPAPPMKYLFDGTIPLGVVAGVNAQGGSGKSRLSMTLAVSLAIGRPLLSTFKPVQQAPTLWFCGEDAEQEVWRRYEQIAKAFNFSDADHNNFKKLVRLYCHAEPLNTSNQGHVSKTTFFKLIEREIEQTGARLVIFDPKAIFFAGDENDNATTAKWFRNLQELASRLNCTIWLSHHTNKAQSREATSDAGRGASAARDAMRAVFSMTIPDSKEVEGSGISEPRRFVKLDLVKANYTPALGDTIWLKFDHYGALREVDMVAQRAEAQDAISDGIIDGVIELVGEDNPDNITCKQLENDYRDDLDASQKQIREAIKRGVELGELRIDRRSHGKRCPISLKPRQPRWKG